MNAHSIRVSLFPTFVLGIIGVIALIVFFGSQNPVLSVALAGVLWWSLIGFWRPRVAFFLFLALLPFVDFLKRLQLAFTDPSPLEWNLVLALPDVLLTSTAIGIIFKAIVTGRLTIRIEKADLWLLAFAVSMLVNIVHSVFPLVVSIAAFKLSGFYILVYFLAPALISKQKHLRLWLKMTFLLSIVVALYGLWQFAFGMSSFEKKWLASRYTGLATETIIYFTFRPFSTLNSPQAYAYYLVIGLICGFAYMRGFISRNNRVIWYIGALVILVALLLSLVRSAILLLVLAWALTKVFSNTHRSKYSWKLILLLVLSVVISLVLILLRFGEVILFKALSSEIPFVQRAFIAGTLGDRLMGWQGLMTNPAYWTLLGYGLGVTSFTLMSKYGLSFDLFSHDEYSGILLEQGIIGVFLFFGFVISLSNILYHRLYALEGHSLRKVGWHLFALFQSILIIGLMGTNLKVTPINVYLWLMAGLLARSTMFAPSKN